MISSIIYLSIFIIYFFFLFLMNIYNLIYLLCIFLILVGNSLIFISIIFIIFVITLILDLLYNSHTLGSLLLLVVYAGAVVVFLVFVIMLINGTDNLKVLESSDYLYFSISLIFLVSILLYYVGSFDLDLFTYYFKLWYYNTLYYTNFLLLNIIYEKMQLYIFVVLTLLIISLIVCSRISSRY